MRQIAANFRRRNDFYEKCWVLGIDRLLVVVHSIAQCLPYRIVISFLKFALLIRIFDEFLSTFLAK